MKFIYRLLKIAVLVVVLLCCAKLLTSQFGLFRKASGLFEHRVVPTNIIVQKSSKIARLVTARFNDDFAEVRKEYYVTWFEDKDGNWMLLDSVLAYKDAKGYFPEKTVIKDFFSYLPKLEDDYFTEETGNKICYIFTGASVRAGYDLSKIKEDGLRVHGDTLVVDLPPVEIFDVVLNPKNYTVFDRVGNCWTPEVENEIFSEVEKDLKKKAIDKGILDLAESSGMDKLYMLFESFGYDHVIFNHYEEQDEMIDDEKVPVVSDREKTTLDNEQMTRDDEQITLQVDKD